MSKSFKIKQSRLFLYFLFINHTLATIASFSNGLSRDYQLIALFTVIISACFSWRNYKNFQPYTIRYHEMTNWQLAKIENDYQKIIVLPTTVLSTQFIILHFQLQTGRKQTLFIINDALTRQNYRCLLVELKVSGLSYHN